MLSFNIGSTTTFPFILPLDSNVINECIITFRQGGNNILNKTLEDENVKLVNNNLIVRLSEKESLMFSDIYNVHVQVKLRSGKAILVSEPIVFDVEKTYNIEQMAKQEEIYTNIDFGTIHLIFN